MAVDLVIAAPVWDRAWCLELWIESVRANVDPKTTGLVFVCPSSDVATRSAIAEHTDGFAWVEVTRDKLQQSSRQDRHEQQHMALAAARNQALAIAIRACPKWVLNWDSDLLLPPGGVELMQRTGDDFVAAWAWLNRQPPQRMRYMGKHGFQEVFWQPPACFTAMRWSSHQGVPEHYPTEQFLERIGSVWPCAVATGAVLMTERAFRRSKYAPHHDGPHVPFCYALEHAGVERVCDGRVVGVHLYDRRVQDEIKMGWPDVMQLAEQAPLAATWQQPRSPEFEALGFYDTNELDAA